MYFYWKIILVNTIFVNNTFFLIFLKYKPIYLLCMYLVTRAGAAMLQLCYLVVQWAAQLQLKLLSYFILREDELQHVSCHLVIPVLFFSWNKYSLVDHMLSPASLMSFFLFLNLCPVWQFLQSELWSECLWGQTHFTFWRSALYILYWLHLCFFYLFLYSFVFVVSIIKFYMVWYYNI